MGLTGTSPKTLAVVTGAYGGAGRAVARRLGARYRLLLAGRDQSRIVRLGEDLTEEGYDIAAAVTADVTSGPSLAELAARPGAVAVCLGSSAAYTIPVSPAVDALLDDPLAADLIPKLEALLRETGGEQPGYAFAVRAYGASKRGMLRLVERTAVEWASRGARVVSVSPGPTLTPMGRAELAANPLAVAAASATPLGPVGRPSDIAAAVDFLTSDSAGYITGCDLRVDGGTVAARLHPPRPSS
jgi:NAD(P)-dependent dehydrogenase (short-subunit alcohol dehydrogenase family)